MLKLYLAPSHVNVEALAPRKATVPQAASSGSGHPIAPPFGAGAVLAPEEVPVPLQARSESALTSHEDVSRLEPNPRALSSIHRLPPALLDEHGNLQCHVEKFIRKRRHHGQNQYLVK